MSLFWTPSLKALVQVICPPCVTLKNFNTPRPSPSKYLAPVPVAFSAVFP